jgi:hypothetical protein
VFLCPYRRKSVSRGWVLWIPFFNGMYLRQGLFIYEVDSRYGDKE